MQESLTTNQQATERLLQNLAPAPSAMSRNDLMYQAGRAAEHTKRRLWPWQTACVALACLCAGSFLFHASPPPAGPVVVRDAPVRPANPPVNTSPLPIMLTSRPTGQTTTRSDYLELRNAVLAHGLDVLQTPRAAGSFAAPPQAPALEGLEGLPSWERRAILPQGDRS